MRYRRSAQRREICTLFNALTKAGIEAANFRSALSNWNTGVVPMPDPRLTTVGFEIVKPQRILPTTMEFVDIAGLVKARPKAKGWVTSVPDQYP